MKTKYVAIAAFSILVLAFENCTGNLSGMAGLKTNATSSLASSTGFGGRTSSFAQAVSGVALSGSAKMADSRVGGYTYGYGPSIIYTQGTHYAYYCSTDNVYGWDMIRVVTSPDLQTWSAPTQVLRTSSFPTERAACDPSVVRAADGFYYLFYGGNHPAEQTLMFVARSTSPMGPFAKLTTNNTWEVNPSNPKAIRHPFHAVPDGASPITYGAGQPTVVYRNNTFYMWYMDDSETYPQVKNHIYLSVSPDAVSWTTPARTNVDDVGSVDVKFDPVTGLWFMFVMENQHQAGAYLAVRTSVDGYTFSNSQTVCANTSCLPRFANNPGVSGDDQGLLLGHDITVGYGAPYDSAAYTSNDCSVSPAPNCWAYWDLASTRVSLKITGQITGTLDTVQAASGHAIVTGWACAYGTSEQIAVQIWAGGDRASGQLLATTNANLASEPGVQAACGDTGMMGHRFSLDLAQSVVLARGGQKIWAYGVSTSMPSGAQLAQSGVLKLPMTAPIAYGAIADGVAISCDSLNPDAIKSLSQETIVWLASIQPSGLTLHENYLVARQNGYNGAFGHGEHSAWLNMDPSRLATFNAAVEAMASAPLSGFGTFRNHHVIRRNAGYQGLFLCGGDACFQQGQCDSLGRRL